MKLCHFVLAIIALFVSTTEALARGYHHLVLPDWVPWLLVIGVVAFLGLLRYMDWEQEQKDKRKRDDRR